MARSRVASGQSINDIMDMPMSKFEQYTPTQQREIVSRLASAANKRLKTLGKNNIENPATIRVNLSGGKFSVRGKQGTELKQEFFRAKQFLGSKFSKTSEWKKFQKKLNEGLKQNKETQDTNDGYYEMGLAFSYYDVLQEIDPRISANREKYRLVDVIADYIKSGDNAQEILNKAKKYLDDRYKEEQESYNQQNINFGDKLDNTPYRFKRKRKKRKR